MKLITNFFDLENLNKILGLADGIVISNNTFSSHINKSFSIQEINMLIKKVKSLGKEVYLQCTLFLYDKDFNRIKKALKEITLDLVDGIIVSDIGFIYLLDEISQKEKVIYHPNTLLTNTFDFNAYQRLNIKGAFLSEEITIDEVANILDNKKYTAFLTGFGYLKMFESRRKLIANYNQYTNTKHESTLKVYEETRENELINVREDQYGTALYRSKILLIPKYLDRLNKLDYLFLDGSFLNDDILIDALKLYQGLISVDKFQQKHSGYSFDDGFLNKNLVSKKGDSNA